MDALRDHSMHALVAKIKPEIDSVFVSKFIQAIPCANCKKTTLSKYNIMENVGSRIRCATCKKTSLAGFLFPICYHAANLLSNLENNTVSDVNLSPITENINVKLAEGQVIERGGFKGKENKLDILSAIATEIKTNQSKMTQMIKTIQDALVVSCSRNSVANMPTPSQVTNMPTPSDVANMPTPTDVANMPTPTNKGTKRPNEEITDPGTKKRKTNKRK